MRIFEGVLRWLRARRGPVLLAMRSIGDDGAVQLAHGDVVVVRCGAPIDDRERQALTLAFERAMPRRIKAVVVGPGVDFDVFGAMPAHEAAPAAEG